MRIIYFVYHYALLMMLYYPSDFAILWASIFGLSLVTISIWAMFKWARRKTVIIISALSYVFAYLVTGVTNWYIQYMVRGSGPFTGDLVAASGFPLTVFTDDSGNTDPSAHEVAIFLNLFFYLILSATILTMLRRYYKKSSTKNKK